MEEKKNKNSDARIRASKKYDDKTYDRFTIRFRKEWGYSELIEERMKELNLSKNEYIIQLIEKDLLQAGKITE